MNSIKTKDYFDIKVNIDRLLNKYTREAVKKSLVEYKRRVKDGSACGELGQSTNSTVELGRVSHKILSLTLNSNYILIDIVTMNNLTGTKLTDILDYNHEHEFQCRTIEKQNSFEILAIDVVNTPGSNEMNNYNTLNHFKMNWNNPKPVDITSTKLHSQQTISEEDKLKESLPAFIEDLNKELIEINNEITRLTTLKENKEYIIQEYKEYKRKHND